MNLEENLIESKSFDFAKSIVRVYRRLSEEKREYVLSKQLLRSGTSIGANIAEARHAQSRADFIAKLSVAQKEANETGYWLRLLHETEYLDEARFSELFQRNEELQRLLAAIIKTLKSNRQNRVL